MTVASAGAVAEFPIGNIFSRASAVCGANFIPFFAVAFVVALPNLLVLLPGVAPSVSGLAKPLIAILLGLALNPIGEAVILFGAFHYLLGQPIGLGEALLKGWARLLPILGFAILYLLGVLVGLLLVGVPAIIWVVMCTAALPACAVEGLGPIACMRRSARLTKEYRVKILWIVAPLMIISVLVGNLIDAVLLPAGIVVKAIGSLVWTAAWGAYWNCVLVMIYHDLRAVKEGINTQQIAAVFD